MHVLVNSAEHICKIYALSVKYLMIFECASKWWNVHTLCWLSETKEKSCIMAVLKNAPPCMFSGFHLVIIETFVLLVCYVALILGYQLFGKNGQSHRQWSSSHAGLSVVERIDCPKMLVATNRHSLKSQKRKDLNTSPFWNIKININVM
jgi:hypothetical protein